MRPCIKSNLPEDVTNEFVRQILERILETLAEINDLAQKDPKHPHQFSVKIIQIFFTSLTEDIPPKNCTIGLRTMASLRVGKDSIRMLDPRDLYFTCGIQPKNEDNEGYTFEDSLNHVAIYCRHTYKDLVRSYAYRAHKPS